MPHVTCIAAAVIFLLLSSFILPKLNPATKESTLSNMRVYITSGCFRFVAEFSKTEVYFWWAPSAKGI